MYVYNRSLSIVSSLYVSCYKIEVKRKKMCERAPNIFATESPIVYKYMSYSLLLVKIGFERCKHNYDAKMRNG